MEGTHSARARATAPSGKTHHRAIGVLAAALACMFVFAFAASSASAEITTFTATETIPVPPASNFAGAGGGDGWAVALSNTAVYQVFHHDEFSLTVNCHEQANAENCEGWPKTISEPGGSSFSAGPQPGMYLDQHTGKLYIPTTRINDHTGGILCVDTTSTEADPFCGFTELTGVGEAPPTQDRSISGMSTPMLIGHHLYSFNFAAGTPTGTEDMLTCFDTSTLLPCTGQPYSVGLPEGVVTTFTNEPIGETAAIGGKAIIPVAMEGKNLLACWDDATQSICGGSWPANLTFQLAGRFGAPFPLLSATGATTGICMPADTDPCVNLAGETVPTPENMEEAIGATEEWNGPGLVLGPRVYVPSGIDDKVHCYDYATGKSCANFPKQMENLELLYTVNPDPQRPTCIWVNSDGGSAQIQSFDAYTGEACGQGAIRVLASQFVVPQPQCTPASYVSLQVLKPARGTYASGSVAFDDGDGNPIGLPEVALDGTGTASLAGLELNTPTGLPQFVFTLTGEQEAVGAVEVQLTWQGNYEAACVGEKTKATVPVTTTPPAATPTPVVSVLPAKAAVKPTGTAHLASSGRACVASSGYVASVSGRNIASVTYTLDGHKLGTLRHASHGAFSLRVKVASGRAHHLSVHVTFTAAAHTSAVTLHKTLARCAARVVTPRFTG